MDTQANPPKIAAFDLESAQIAPEERSNPNANFALGITCAAICVDGVTEVYSGVPQLTQAQTQELVGRLRALTEQGCRLVSWNGTSFDWRVLAAESGMRKECIEIANAHTDLMLCVTFQVGYMLGLEKALLGAGLAGKTHAVTLRSGEVITAMEGMLAPKYWADGEYDAVITYLRGDVERLYELALWVQKNKRIKWTSSTGKPQQVAMPKLYTVQELFSLPKPDTSWMKNPPSRQSFVAWTKGS